METKICVVCDKETLEKPSFNFLGTPEFQNYLEILKTALKTMEDFKSFLNQWEKRHLSLFAR